MLYKKSPLLHGPIFRQVYTKAFDKGNFHLQCTYCNLFDAEKEENGRYKCKSCFGNKTCEYLTAVALKRMELNYEVQYQYSSKECFYKKPLYIDFRLYPTLLFSTRFFLEVLENWHSYEDDDSKIKNALKLQHFMIIKEPIFYLYEEDFGLNYGNEESCTLNIIPKLEDFFKTVEKIDSCDKVERDLLLDELYKKSPYYSYLKF
ncbi:hypothetical protein HNR63_002405 [Anoxybacillus kamchatkensis]|uniref:hypothetical protein n=1 Tax=Anoxybacillus ayderensis TaxID=265546 RepID=UPI0015ECD15D|nr:hypothetical protein [Anoxybacillus ayderensis]MBA2879333.1 hypothetical protein [Anoxybacillus ayderensis]